MGVCVVDASGIRGQRIRDTISMNRGFDIGVVQKSGIRCQVWTTRGFNGANLELDFGLISNRGQDVRFFCKGVRLPEVLMNR